MDKGDTKTASQEIVSVGPIVKLITIDIFRLKLDNKHSSTFAIFRVGVFAIVAIGYVECEEHRATGRAKDTVILSRRIT